MPATINDEGLIELGSNRVQLLPYRPRPFKAIAYASDNDILNGAGGTLVVDTECYTNYFLIAFKDVKTKKIIRLEAPFNERQLSWIMHNYRTVGFNSIKYDMPMIWLSYHRQDLANLQDLSKALVSGMMFPQQAAKDFNFKIYPTNHIDLFEVAPLRGSLKLYGARLHADRIQDLPFDPFSPIDDTQKEIVANYCFNDLDNTELMFDNLLEQLSLRISLSTQYKYDMLSKSDAQIAEAVIGNELKAITGHWPKKPDINSSTFFHSFQIPTNLYFQTPYLQGILKKISEIKFSVGESGRLEPSIMNDIRVTIGNSVYRMGIGGLHSSEECRAIKSSDEYVIKDIDVESFYPAIVINQKLYPKHLGSDFTNVYTVIRDRRVDAKRNKRIAESENLKVTINGTFGKTGSPYSFLYAPEMTIQITVGGQLYLLMLIELIELNGIPVASANTDGIVVLCSHNKIELLASIVKQWEATTSFKTEETTYEAIYSRDVNAYLAIKKKEGVFEFKGKNDYYDPWRGKSAKDKYWRFQKNPTHQICIEAIERLISEGTPIEETIKQCKDITKFVCVKNVKGGAHKNREYLGKVVRWYISKEVVGTINYILSGNKVPETDGARPAMDLPEIFPTDINYSWYINKTIEMLEDMAFIEKQKQISFF